MQFTVDGKRVFAGTGGRDHAPGLSAVVLVHGAGMDHSVFALQARALAHHGRNVLALDLPGHGGSDGPALDSIAAMADWVLRAASAAGIERLRLAGHSMGGLIALEAAARGADRVEALALLGFVPEMRVLERADPASLAADLAACDGYRDAAAAAAQLRCPVLLLLGGDDRMTPAS